LDTTLELLGLIYDAVADAKAWPIFLEALVGAANAALGSLALASLPMDELAVVCWHGWKSEDYPLYRDRYMPFDPWVPALMRLDEGAVGTTEDLCPREETEASATYREFYKPRGCHYGCGCCILRTATTLSCVIVARDSTVGPFGEREKAVLRPLIPHLRRATLLHGEVASLRSQLAAFSGHLDRYPQAFLLIDPDCRVLYQNSAGREINAQGDGLSVEAGRLLVGLSHQNTAMRSAVREIASNHEASLHRLEIRRPSGKRPYRLVLLPLLDSGAVPLGVVPPVAAALIIDPDSTPRTDPAMLRELFSLTPAEARVTGLLVGGYSLEEAASELFVSIETVRTHTRRVLSKTATKRQGELISLVLRSIPFRRV
jgi:DNA-binding CsgD family transcriptional regulator